MFYLVCSRFFLVSYTKILSWGIEEATKLYFMHPSCIVIILFNTDLQKSAFSIYSFKKLVSCLSMLYGFCLSGFVFVDLSIIVILACSLSLWPIFWKCLSANAVLGSFTSFLWLFNLMLNGVSFLPTYGRLHIAHSMR